MPMMSIDINRLERLEARTTNVEHKMHLLETAEAVTAERHLSIVKRLERIDGHVSKLVWVFIVALIGAFMSFVSKGGLNV